MVFIKSILGFLCKSLHARIPSEPFFKFCVSVSYCPPPYCVPYPPICPLSLSSSMPWCYSSCSPRSVIPSSITWPAPSWLMTWMSWMTPVSSPEGHCLSLVTPPSAELLWIVIFWYLLLRIVTFTQVYSLFAFCKKPPLASEVFLFWTLPQISYNWLWQMT